LGFFDFVEGIPPYSENRDGAMRLNKRYDLILDPFRTSFSGTRVLDLGAHDGRWAYAMAEAGAKRVVGVEARPELVERFRYFPDTDYKSRVDLRVGEIFATLEALVADGEEFDVVAIFGVFYHIMDHFRLLQMIRLLGAKLVLIDSEFVQVQNPIIQLMFERTSSPLNSPEQVPGQDQALIGIPSFRAMGAMARALNLEIVWSDAEAVFGHDRKGVQDYFRKEGKRRAACCLLAGA